MIFQSLLANETLWGIANALLRAAASIFIRRIFIVPVLIRRLTHVLAIISTLHGLATFLEALLICRPISAGWENSVSGRCGHQTASFLALEIIGLVLDFTILVIPLFPIKRLNLPSRQRLQLMGLFSVGFM